MMKRPTIVITVLLAILLGLLGPAPATRADIFQWEYINPSNPSQGKQPSTVLCPDGAGGTALPGANLSHRNLTMAYLIGAYLNPDTDDETHYVRSDLTGANLTQADL